MLQVISLQHPRFQHDVRYIFIRSEEVCLYP